MGKLWVALIWAIAACNADVAAAFRLELPLDCSFGNTCWIQQYADHDSGPGAKDYRCSGETYDGHDGTDFRVLNTQSDVTVIAAAAGVVKAVRDRVDDQLATTPAALAAVAKVECGNGVVVYNSEGYETQYCHMRKGSIAVKVGDQVSTGAPLGKVGFSGAAAFAHLHLSVRLRGQKIDPFSGPIQQSCAILGQSLWSDAARKALEYHAGDILETGWADQALQMQDFEVGRTAITQPNAAWPALVAFVRAINLKVNDDVFLKLVGPQGEIATSTQRLDHDKAQYLVFAGAKSHGKLWPAGDYEAQFIVSREGKPMFERRFKAHLD